MKKLLLHLGDHADEHAEIPEDRTPKPVVDSQHTTGTEEVSEFIRPTIVELMMNGGRI